MLMGRRAFTGAGRERARRARAMTVTALIVAAGAGSRMGGDTAQAISAARRQAGARPCGRCAGRPSADRRGAGRDRRRARRSMAQRRARRARRRRADHRRRRAGRQRPRRARRGRRRDRPGPRRRPPLLPAGRRSTGCSTRSTAHDGAVPVLPVADTLAHGRSRRSARWSTARGLLRVQTPQAFHVEDLLYAYRRSWTARADRRIDGDASPPG